MEISKANPLNSTINIGGKEILETGEMVKQWLQARSKRKWLINFPNVGEMMKQIANGNLTCNEVASDSITWNEWLKKKYGNLPVPELPPKAGGWVTHSLILRLSSPISLPPPLLSLSLSFFPLYLLHPHC